MPRMGMHTRIHMTTHTTMHTHMFRTVITTARMALTVHMVVAVGRCCWATACTPLAMAF